MNCAAYPRLLVPYRPTVKIRRKYRYVSRPMGTLALNLRILDVINLTVIDSVSVQRAPSRCWVFRLGRFDSIRY